jgi:hypothetical protein
VDGCLRRRDQLLSALTGTVPEIGAGRAGTSAGCHSRSRWSQWSFPVSSRAVTVWVTASSTTCL